MNTRAASLLLALYTKSSREASSAMRINAQKFAGKNNRESP